MASTDLDLHQLYRAMAWLGEELPETNRTAPRSSRHAASRTSSRGACSSGGAICSARSTSCSWTRPVSISRAPAGRRSASAATPKIIGRTFDQMILAVLLDGDGRPVCTEMWPGNTADAGSLVPVVDRLRKRFSISRVCVVADRGMISAETIAELEARGLLLHSRRARAHRQAGARTRARRSRSLRAARHHQARQEIDYEAKAVALAGRRYIVCRNREEAKKDAADQSRDSRRARTVNSRKATRRLSATAAIARFLATPDDDRFVIDRAKAEEDAKFDGIFVLRTNTDLAPLDAMLCYKQLTMVEHAFRTAKSLFATRPIFHKLDETIRGHVSCSFLALVLKKALEDRIADARPAELLARTPRRSQLAHRDARSNRTANASCCAQPHVPPPASPCAPPASPCRPPSGSSPKPDPAQPSQSPKCSAKPLFRRGFLLRGQCLADSNCRRSNGLRRSCRASPSEREFSDG